MSTDVDTLLTGACEDVDSWEGIFHLDGSFGHNDT